MTPDSREFQCYCSWNRTAIIGAHVINVAQKRNKSKFKLDSHADTHVTLFLPVFDPYDSCSALQSSGVIPSRSHHETLALSAGTCIAHLSHKTSQTRMTTWVVALPSTRRCLTWHAIIRL